MDERTKQRCDQLFKMGLRFNGQYYVGQGGNSDINFHYTDIQFDLDKEWNEKVEKVEKEMERREEIRRREVPTCSFCGREETCEGGIEGCFLDHFRDAVDVFKA